MISALSYSLAFSLGALHAIEPGHGKAALAAYFVGTRIRLKDALIASFATAVAHSISILGLAILIQGGATLYNRHLQTPHSETNSSHHVGTEHLIEHFSHFIGALIALYGLYLAFRTARSKWFTKYSAASVDHGAHSHAHACASCESHSHIHIHSHSNSSALKFETDQTLRTTSPKSWRHGALFGFGIGLVPCPTALAAYFSALAKGDAESATWTVAVFGLGIFTSFAALALVLAFGQKHLSRASRKFQISRTNADFIQAGLLIAIGLYTALQHHHAH